MAWLLLAGAIAFEVAATMSLRASEGFTRWGWAVPIVVGYATSFVLLAFVLKRGVPVGVAYGICSGVGVAATAILARLFFDDPFTAPMGYGVARIGAGRTVLACGSAGRRSR